LHKDSYQIDPKQAQLIAAVLKDPLGYDPVKSQLMTQLQISEDFILRQSATVFVFHVPGAYWKLVIVKPTSEIAGAANRII
jgi:two-component system, NtrC family, sensor kinase